LARRPAKNLEGKQISAPTIPNLNWEEVRSFLETGRRGSFTAAASHLGLSINSVRRRVAQLERSISHQLLTPSHDGIKLTAHGLRVMAMAKKMEDNAFDLLASTGMAPLGQVETVRFATHDALGPLWIAPRLAEYQERSSEVLVELISTFQSSDVLKLDADVMLQVGRPPPAEFKSLRLGRIHSVPTVGSKFLANRKMPRNLAELKGQKLVLLDRPLSLQMFSRTFPGIAQEEIVALRTNNPMVQLMSVLSGAGFAWIPTYIHAVVPGLHVVPIEGVFSTDIWLARSAASEGLARVTNLWNWIAESFSHARAPWFRDDYIAPDLFPDANKIGELGAAAR
jgi:DNA-binding transcriptional LysR family regulator